MAAKKERKADDALTNYTFEIFNQWASSKACFEVMLFFSVRYTFLSKVVKYFGKYWNVGDGKRNKSFNSANWLIRRDADLYTELARKQNYRCRSAFKLIQINEKYQLVKPGFKVLDLGAAPGSWSQVLADQTNSNEKDSNSPVGLVIAVDLNIIQPINGVVILSKTDFTLESSQEKILEILGMDKKFDFIFSDMAPPASGIKSLDREKCLKIIYPVLLFSVRHLKEDGGCLIKILNGVEHNAIVKDMTKFFKYLRFIKPDASYSSSSENYLLLRNFLGLKT